MRQALAIGERFYTVSPTTADKAEVHADICRYYGCSVRTIRSSADAVTDNNLDNLPTCSVSG